MNNNAPVSEFVTPAPHNRMNNMIPNSADLPGEAA